MTNDQTLTNTSLHKFTPKLAQLDVEAIINALKDPLKEARIFEEIFSENPNLWLNMMRAGVELNSEEVSDFMRGATAMLLLLRRREAIEQLDRLSFDK